MNDFVRFKKNTDRLISKRDRKDYLSLMQISRNHCAFQTVHPPV